MALVVHAVGLRGPLPEDPRWRILHVPADRAPFVRGPVLVLGEAGLRRADRDALAGWLAAGGRRLLLCAERLDPALLNGWSSLFSAMVRPEGLGGELERLGRQLRLPLRPWPVEPACWLPVPPPSDPFLAHALCELARGPVVHDLDAWADRCGLKLRQLREELRKATGLLPRELLSHYLLAQAEAADRAGVSRADLAALLGYADASGLGHALQRARARCRA